MKLFLTTLSLLLLFFHSSNGQNLINLTPIATGFDRPVDISNAGDDRLFITEQDGVIKIINASGTVNQTPFLDIDAQVNSGGNERGLLGLTFHPDYANNGYFYVNYIDLGGDTKVSRFSVSTTDPDIADPNSELNLLAINQPFSNHNAGDLEFGPDGYLYIGSGDGGSGGDPGNRSQNRQTLLGKMLRIDVDNGSPYSIPLDNPFVGDATTLDEIWAIGLRNPWRFSFDGATGDLYIADVGQDDWEEIDFQAANSTGGENYGWRCYEGNATFNTSNCPPASEMTFPIHEYVNSFSSGCSITGGYVYRGTDYPGLQGKYIYADFCTGNFWWLENAGGAWTNTPIGTFTSMNFATFGEDIDGELYVAGLSDGMVYRISDLLSDIEETAWLHHFEVSPNPFTNQLQLDWSLKGASLLHFQLVDVAGRTVWESIDFKGSSLGIDVSDLGSGIYFLHASGAEGTLIRKVIKE